MRRMTRAVAEIGEHWIPSDATFGARLALIRQQMGWGNLKEAALACGLPQESWRSWERDNRTPRDYSVVCKKIAERTGCDLFWLLTGEAPTRPHEHPGAEEIGADRPQAPGAATHWYSASRQYRLAGNIAAAIPVSA